MSRADPQTLAVEIAAELRGRCPATMRRWAYTPGQGWRRRELGQTWEPDPEALRLRELVTAHCRASKLRGIRFAAVVSELEPLLAEPGPWDADPYLVGLPSGLVLDLRTGERRWCQHELVSRRLGVEPETGEPWRWLEVIGHLCPDADAAHWLRRWVGYTLTGSVREHRFVFFAGPGGGGKGTFTETLRAVLGSYAAGVPEDVFVGGATRHREWLARLAGARMAVIPDLPAGGWSNIGLLKSLVAGDAQTANFMRRGSFEFVPAAKLYLSGQHKPALGRSDSGFARRLVLIPVTPIADPDPKFTEALRSELPQIAHWAVTGAAQWLERGSLGDIPPQWANAAAQYQADEDTIAQWWAEHITLSAHGFEAGSDLAASYSAHSGRKLSRATPIYEWLNENPIEGVHKGEARPHGRTNSTPGLHGIRLDTTDALTP